jgi:hypothetical protein
MQLARKMTTESRPWIALPGRTECRAEASRMDLTSMTYKSSFLLTAMTLVLAAVASIAHAVFNKWVPAGYEDEGGFHSGEEPEG